MQQWEREICQTGMLRTGQMVTLAGRAHRYPVLKPAVVKSHQSCYRALTKPTGKVCHPLLVAGRPCSAGTSKSVN